MLIGIGITLLVFLLMEVKAWLMHKYVLHGFLWNLHQSHHTPRKTFWEWNDLFFAYYGLLAMLCFIFGTENLDWRFWTGIGISLYGLVYFVVHDLYIHRRLKIFGKTGNSYLRALDIAHKVHHKTRGRNGSESFGMLWVHPKFFRLAKQKNSI
ncbi:sterol desaturase family protein [Adhaeribacter terreus]|uniref:Sterol desaturase family protein n=1 Tax=Adhaeribacter terreus TaxID=529703 RepID=A0ABW0E941_9BACT